MTPIIIPSAQNCANPITSDRPIPEPLQKGGSVDRLLQEASHAGNPGDWSLFHTIDTQLATVRNECTRTPASNLPTVLSNVDPVFRVCLAAVCDLDITDAQYHEALQSYKTKPGDYVAVLGQLIPMNFREWADNLISREEYRNGTNSTALDDWEVFLNELDTEAQRSDVGLCCKSDLPSLDHALLGLDGLSFVAGPKGVGKTSLLLSFAHSLLKDDPDLAVLIYTLEMPKSRLLLRLYLREAGVDARTLKCAVRQPEVTAQLRRADQDARQFLSRLRLIERHQVIQREGFSEHLLTGDTNRLKRESGATKALVLIDNFQRMDVRSRIFTSADDEGIRISTDAAKDDFRLDSIQASRYALRTDWQPNGPPVIAASEITKREHSRRNGQIQEFSVDDLRGSGRLASDAETILLLWPERHAFDGAATVPLNLRIAKGRDGVIRKDIPVNFHHTLSRFSERTDGQTSGTTRVKRKSSTSGGRPRVNPLSDK